MWICLNDGFLSAVEHKDAPDRLMVRARKRGHLVAVFGKDAKIIKSPPGSDYAYRISVSKKDFAEIITNRIMNLDYPNFKDSVKDNRLHNMYARWWLDHVKAFVKVEDK